MVCVLPSKTPNKSNLSVSVPISRKPALRRARADADIQKIIIDYLEQVATSAAVDFIEELEVAITHIRAYPASGSPRYAHILDLPGLRCWPCQHFPYLIFYLEKTNCIDVWRVLHQQRDIPAWLLSDKSGGV